MQLQTSPKILALAVITALLSACASSGTGSSSTSSSSMNTSPALNVNLTTDKKGTYAESSLADKKAAMTGEGVYVGVVDTGIKRDSKGLVNRNSRISTKVIKDDTRELENTDDIDLNTEHGDGHGTKMTEIILDTAPNVAVNLGAISKEATPYEDEERKGKQYHGLSPSTGLRNLLRAMDAGVKVDVLNNSYGNDVESDNPEEVYGKNNEKLKNDWHTKYYQEFVNRGTLVVKATGNNDKKLANIGATLPLENPKLEKGFIAVTAWNQNNNEKTQNACGLAKNWCITAPEYFKTYGLKNEKSSGWGTSNATAYITALAARIKSRYDWFTNEDLKNTLLTTADDKGAPGVDEVWGHGLVNADRSLQGYGRFDKQHVFNVDGIKKAYFFDNDISGKGGMTKKGKDILVMNGNNTYTGNTLIQEGELVANGNSVSAHKVSAGAKLTIGDSAETIRLGEVTNAGTLDVQAANLQVNGNLAGQGGQINQAIGSKILVSGSANLDNSTLTLTGVRQGYVTKVGNTEVLLNADNGISVNSLTVNVAQNSLGELINNSYHSHANQLSITFYRESIGNVLRNKTEFTGRDKTVQDLDGLLDRMDITKLSDSYKEVAQANSQTQGAEGIAQALMTSQNLQQTVFAMSTATAQHAQEHLVREKAIRADKTIAHALTATAEGNMWVDAGFGKTKAKGLADVNGESRDDSQTLGIAHSFGAHAFAAQISRVSNRWTEKLYDVNKDIDTRGAAFEAAYSYKFGDNYWLSAVAGIDALKAKSAYGSDKGYQYMLGLSSGKVFQWENFSLMPQLGIKHIRLSGLDYELGRFGGDTVAARDAKTRETGLTAGLDGWWTFGQKAQWQANLGVKLYQPLNSKTNYTAYYGPYAVAKQEKNSTHRPDVDVHAGVAYRATDNLSLHLMGGYEEGKYRDRRYINVGLGYRF